MTRPSVYKQRLLKLADYLETIPRKTFDFGVFYEEGDCGTVGCALGHACDIPSFKRAGLKRYCQGADVSRLFVIEYRGWRWFCAGEEFFGLTTDESYRLFDPDMSGLGARATPKRVAKNIRAFVAQKFARK